MPTSQHAHDQRAIVAARAFRPQPRAFSAAIPVHTSFAVRYYFARIAGAGRMQALLVSICD